MSAVCSVSNSGTHDRMLARVFDILMVTLVLVARGWEEEDESWELGEERNVPVFADSIASSVEYLDSEWVAVSAVSSSRSFESAGSVASSVE